MKVWITKYALTDGIIETEGKNISSESFRITEGNFKDSWFSSKDCFTDKKSAIKRAEEMRQKRIKSLKKQIEKLEEMRFE